MHSDVCNMFSRIYDSAFVEQLTHGTPLKFHQMLSKTSMFAAGDIIV